MEVRWILSAVCREEISRKLFWQNGWQLSQRLYIDEPTRGIDVGAKVAVYELMNKLVEEGVGVIITSSEVEEVWNMSDKIVILKEGNMVGMFDSKELDQKQMQLYM